MEIEKRRIEVYSISTVLQTLECRPILSALSTHAWVLRIREIERPYALDCSILNIQMISRTRYVLFTYCIRFERVYSI